MSSGRDSPAFGESLGKITNKTTEVDARAAMILPGDCWRLPEPLDSPSRGWTWHHEEILDVSIVCHATRVAGVPSPFCDLQLTIAAVPVCA